MLILSPFLKRHRLHPIQIFRVFRIRILRRSTTRNLVWWNSLLISRTVYSVIRILQILCFKLQYIIIFNILCIIIIQIMIFSSLPSSKIVFMMQSSLNVLFVIGVCSLVFCFVDFVGFFFYGVGVLFVV
jgi:hypothetical protein